MNREQKDVESKNEKKNRINTCRFSRYFEIFKLKQNTDAIKEYAANRKRKKRKH